MRYSLPAEDACQLDGTTVATSAEDSAYLAENLIDVNPAKPAKWTTTSGTATITLPTSTAVVGVAILYHNIAAGVSVDVNGESVTIPTWHEDGWPTNAFKLFGSPITASVFTVTIGANTANLVVGRVWLLTAQHTTALTFRASPAPQIEEEHGIVEMATELGVETIYELGGKRRALTVEFWGKLAQSTEMQGIRRYTQGRSQAFLIWPFAAENDPWIVRFEDRVGTRIYTIDIRNTFPFRVKELSRGLPWP